MPNISLFVDGSNMFHAQKKMGFHIDYVRLKDYFSKGKNLTNCIYYKGVMPSESPKEQKFLTYLTYNGFSIVKKEVKTIYDDYSGEPKQKCNLDIEIAIDMVNYADKYDEAILFSGDGDFERAVKLLRDRGKIIKIASCRGMIARELAQVANQLIFLEEHKRFIQRVDKKDKEKKKIGK